MSKRRFLYILLLFSCICSHAQLASVRTIHIDSTMMKLASMTTEDYMAIELPPLDVLYANALEMSNAVKYFEYESEYYHRAARSERIKPLEWIRLIATYNYGNSDLAAVSLMETTYQVWMNNQSSQRNQYYNVGVTINIPLSQVFDQENKARQWDAKARQSDYRKLSELDQIKQDIIEQYCTIVESMGLLESASDRLVVAQAQYDINEADFVNAKLTAEALYRSESYVAASFQEYERIRKELNQALLTLEVLSCTPIVSK